MTTSCSSVIPTRSPETYGRATSARKKKRVCRKKTAEKTEKSFHTEENVKEAKSSHSEEDAVGPQPNRQEEGVQTKCKSSARTKTAAYSEDEAEEATDRDYWRQHGEDDVQPCEVEDEREWLHQLE